MGITLSKMDFDLETEKRELEKMIDNTEELYGFISERLPEIEQEIEDTIEETELLINYFTETEIADSKTEEAKVERGAQIAEVLNNLQSKIHQVYEALSARKGISELLEGFIQSEEGEAEFNQILNVIEELNKVLADLENLSINAIIFAVKGDKEGAAFRVISDEINNLSGQLKDKYEVIKQDLHVLRTWYDDFVANLQSLIEMEENISLEYKGQIHKIFNQVLESLQVVADLLKDFMNHIEGAVEPIYEIIVLLQNQDIIRQNIENLIEIITVLQQEFNKLNLGGETSEEILNRLVFINDVSRLAQKLMKNILNQLDDSLFEIQDKFERMEESLLEVEEEGDQIFAFLAGENSRFAEGKNSIDLIYKKLINFVPQLTEELDRLVGRYKSIISNQDTFYKNMEGLKERFKEIDKVANRFEKLEILAKIEFTRMNTSDQSFIQNIEGSIERFINSSDRNKRLYNQLKQELVNNYNEFVELSKQDKEKIISSSEIIEESERKLLMTKKLIKDAIKGLHQTINKLISDILKVNDEIDEVYQLKDAGARFIDYLSQIEKRTQELKESYLESLGKEKWEVDNPRLRELEDKFSSYLERKTASEEIANLDIDTGSEGGDLTLF